VQARRRTRKPDAAKFLTGDQARHLLETVRASGRARDFYLLAVTFYLGLREGEAVRLHRACFRLRDDEVWVPTLKKRNLDRHDIDCKTGLPWIPIHLYGGRHIVDAMLAWTGRRGWIFEGERGQHLSERGARRIFRHWARRAGLDPRTSMHALRHTAGSLLYEKTKDVLVVRDFLRHSNVTTTDRYLHATAWRGGKGALAL